MHSNKGSCLVERSEGSGLFHMSAEHLHLPYLTNAFSQTDIDFSRGGGVIPYLEQPAGSTPGAVHLSGICLQTPGFEPVTFRALAQFLTLWEHPSTHWAAAALLHVHGLQAQNSNWSLYTTLHFILHVLNRISWSTDTHTVANLIRIFQMGLRCDYTSPRADRQRKLLQARIVSAEHPLWIHCARVSYCSLET